ncbi:hypothetical protein T05_123 [Trichinella murrelli]|uniref:Uncharacterized protein n=1 Tax=Trichinella murrelli TaxID=144512 RepID=A0A0V0U374_9BILA|nr:hypothetical protein T05_123 [Trichinella murrelli]
MTAWSLVSEQIQQRSTSSWWLPNTFHRLDNNITRHQKALLALACELNLCARFSISTLTKLANNHNTPHHTTTDNNYMKIPATLNVEEKLIPRLDRISLPAAIRCFLDKRKARATHEGRLMSKVSQISGPVVPFSTKTYPNLSNATAPMQSLFPLSICSSRS